VAAANLTRLVCFDLHGQEYAARIDQVKETLTLRPITRVFLVPPWIAGIVNLRGDIVAVIDLALLLGMQPTRLDDDSRIVIAVHDGRRAGILVNRMAELRDADLTSLQPPPPTLPAEVAELFLGIATVDGGKPLRVLDLALLFDTDRLRVATDGATERIPT